MQMNYDMTASHYVYGLDFGIVLLADLKIRTSGWGLSAFLIIVNISLLESDGLQRWKVFIAVWIASSVKMKSQWAEYGPACFPMLVQVNEDVMI